MATLKDIQDKVDAETTIEASAITLLTGLSQQIKDLVAANGTPADFQALADKLDANNKALSDAVAANTPAAPVV